MEPESVIHHNLMLRYPHLTSKMFSATIYTLFLNLQSDPNIWARECDASQFQCEGFQILVWTTFCTLQHPVFPKRGNSSNFHKHYFGSEADPTLRVVSRAAERSGECASKKKKITARSHLRTHVIVSKSCERRVRHKKTES